MPDLITALAMRFSHSAVNAPGTPGANSHIVDKTELYVGATIMTPVKGLTFGASWDSINNADLGTGVVFPGGLGVPASLGVEAMPRQWLAMSPTKSRIN